jgi:hypothetical protein
VKRDGMPGYRHYFRVPLVSLCRLGSWDHPAYRLLGAWRSRGGVTLRYRGWLLRLGR